MSQHDPEDLAERGRSIFDRLRAQLDSTQAQDIPVSVVTTVDEGDPESDIESNVPLRQVDGLDDFQEAAPDVSSPPPDRPKIDDTNRPSVDDLTLEELEALTAPDHEPTEGPIADRYGAAASNSPPETIREELEQSTQAAPTMTQEVTASEPQVEPLPESEPESQPEPRPEPDPDPEIPLVGRRNAAGRLLPPLPRIMAIANQKGGVGKTTTAVNLGAALAELGYRVLVIDLDPQGNATTGLGINARNLDTSVYDVIMRDVPVEDCVEPTSLRNLFVVPATIDLAGAEIELVPAFSREMKLKKALEAVTDDFDYIVIDCPPSLGLLTVNGLAAATEVVVPIQCEYYALEGLGQLLRNVTLVRQNLNPTLDVSTIILTMYDARTKLAEHVAREVRSHFGEKVCRNIVPRTVRLSEAPSFGQPIITFDPTSRGALAYRELAKEVSGGAPQRTG